MDCTPLDVSEIGTVCDEINVHPERGQGLANGAVLAVHGSQNSIEEFLENPCAKMVSEPNAMWSQDMVRLYIAGKTKDQAGS